MKSFYQSIETAPLEFLIMDKSNNLINNMIMFCQKMNKFIEKLAANKPNSITAIF